jgi:ABC-type phosphate transport system permease subunit
LSTGTPSTYPTSSGNATMALVLGIIGLLGSLGSCCCCLFWFLGLCAPAGWYVGSQELQAIRAGRSPASGEGTAKAGMVCGIIGTVFMALYMVGIAIYIAVVGVGVALETMKQGGLPLPQ